MSNILVTNMFASFQEYINSKEEIQDKIRSVVKEISIVSRNIVTLLQIIHHHKNIADSESSINNCCLKVRCLLEDVRSGYKNLAKIVPFNEYYRYHDQWENVTRRLVFSIALIIFLEVGIVVSFETVAELLNIETDPSKGFHLDLEDYLFGLLHLCSELARFAMNSVTNEDFHRPLQIAKFVGDIDAGFRLLNLRNDSLRKRFDVLKYDLKKIEEIVYDIGIRNLKSDTSSNVQE